MKATILLSAVMALSATVTAGATTFAASPPAHVPLPPQVPPAVTHKVRSAIVNSGFYGGSGGGLVPLDFQSFSCNSKTGSCTLSMSGMAYICTSSDSESTISLEFYVDGNLVQFFPSDLAPGFCGSAPALVNFSVSTGSHSVTFAEDGDYSDFIYNWDDRIDILTP